MSTHNICFHGEIRKILCGYPLLSVANHSSSSNKMHQQVHVVKWTCSNLRTSWVRSNSNGGKIFRTNVFSVSSLLL